MFKVHSLKADFQTSPHLLLGVIDDKSDPRGIQVCLVSDLEFTGNARFKAGRYFIYPSIQSFVWKVAVDSKALPGIEPLPLKVTDLDIWPTLDKDMRIKLASQYDLPYFSASTGVQPTSLFNNLVLDLFELGQDFVIPDLEPNYMSFEKYVEMWKGDPVQLLKSKEDLSLAIGSRTNLAKHLEKLTALRQNNEYRDFNKIMITRMTNVLTQQSAILREQQTTNPSYLTVMKTLGIRRAVVSDSKLDLEYLREKNQGVTYTAYFAGELQK